MIAHRAFCGRPFRRRGAVFVGAALALATVVGMAAPTRAYCRLTTDPGAAPCAPLDGSRDPPERYLEWRRPRFPVALAFGDRGPPVSTEFGDEELRAVLRDAFATWVDVDCGGGGPRVVAEVLEGVRADRAAGYDPDLGDANVGAVLFLDEGGWAARDHERGAVAITTVWHSTRTGEILDADIEINDGESPFAICGEDGCPNRVFIDLPNILTHEAGHAFGIAHSDDPEATMFGLGDRGETRKRSLAPDDEAAICAVYGGGCGCRVGGFSAGGVGWPAAFALLLLAARVVRRRR